MKRKEKELLSLKTTEEVYDCLLMSPWGLIENDLPSLFNVALSYQSTTPTSTLFSFYGIQAQCSPGLLPVAVQGNPAVWRSRLIKLYKYI